MNFRMKETMDVVRSRGRGRIHERVVRFMGISASGGQVLEFRRQTEIVGHSLRGESGGFPDTPRIKNQKMEMIGGPQACQAPPPKNTRKWKNVRSLSLDGWQERLGKDAVTEESFDFPRQSRPRQRPPVEKHDENHSPGDGCEEEIEKKEEKNSESPDLNHKQATEKENDEERLENKNDEEKSPEKDPEKKDWGGGRGGLRRRNRNYKRSPGFDRGFRDPKNVGFANEQRKNQGTDKKDLQRKNYSRRKEPNRNRTQYQRSEYPGKPWQGNHHLQKSHGSWERRYDVREPSYIEAKGRRYCAQMPSYESGRGRCWPPRSPDFMYGGVRETQRRSRESPCRSLRTICHHMQRLQISPCRAVRERCPHSRDSFYGNVRESLHHFRQSFDYGARIMFHRPRPRSHSGSSDLHHHCCHRTHPHCCRH